MSPPGVDNSKHAQLKESNLSRPRSTAKKRTRSNAGDVELVGD
ncbi:hypothetical protein FTUN_7014 [Frigoriglobus tundricola]|uniref:Uncharacterized protein n=1 Tax=Frigoriglobus tundricola TaxID=2774151 RepID=A0A6M5Z2I8_9BACT|nr:hypothetical protein FTUN_7014 [Frigoriglobus tundricola]